MTLMAHHRDLVENGRPDLMMVTMTSRSRDLLNPGAAHLANYLVGDAIAVIRLQRRPTAEDQDFYISYADMLDPKRNRFWMIGDFYLIQRQIIKNCLITKLSRKITESTYHSCIADGFNVPVRFEKKILQDKCGQRPKNGNINHGTIFNPVLQPGVFLSGTKGGQRNATISQNNEYSPIIHFYPSLLSCESIPEDVREELLSAPEIFGYHYQPVQSKKVPEILHRTGHFGLSGLMTMENKNRDLAFYPTKILEVLKKEKKDEKGVKNEKGEEEEEWRIKFGLNTASGPPCLSAWQTQTTFSLNYKNYLFEMVVESFVKVPKEHSVWYCDSIHKEHGLMVIAYPVSKNDEDLEIIKELKDKNVVVFQAILDNLNHLRSFPNLYRFRKIQWDSRFGKVLAGFLGGLEVVGEDWKEFEFPRNGLLGKLNNEQSMYARAMVQGSSPGVVVDACFRSGKTLTIAVTANLLALRDSEGLKDYKKHPKNLQNIHIACSTTNLATTYLTRAHLSLPNHCPAVRLISQGGYDKASNQIRTRIDFPNLWPEVLRNHVIEFSEIDNRTLDEIVISAVCHLARKGYMAYSELEDLDLEQFAKKSFIAPMGLFETFVEIYKPRIVFGTVSALIEGFCNDSLGCIKTKISTIQCDNAHQLPMYSFVSLGTWLPNARYSFLGDPKQLPPFSGKLPYVLEQYANGDIMGSAIRKFQQKFEFRSVYNTSPSIVELCNEMFYNCIRPAHFDFQGHRKLEALTGKPFGIQLLDLYSKHHGENSYSLENQTEAEMAKDLVKELRESLPKVSIGVLCFYKAQAGRVAQQIQENVFINTVDGSQDNTFDVTIILTTRTTRFDNSDFLTDPQRINVALSRARLGAFVILSEGAAEESEIWRRLLSLVPCKGHLDAGWFLEDLQMANKKKSLPANIPRQSEPKKEPMRLYKNPRPLRFYKNEQREESLDDWGLEEEENDYLEDFGLEDYVDVNGSLDGWKLKPSDHADPCSKDKNEDREYSPDGWGILDEQEDRSSPLERYKDKNEDSTKGPKKDQDTSTLGFNDHGGRGYSYDGWGADDQKDPVSSWRLDQNQLDRFSPRGPPSLHREYRELANETDHWDGTKHPSSLKASNKYPSPRREVCVKNEGQDGTNGAKKYEDREYSDDGWNIDHQKDCSSPKRFNKDQEDRSSPKRPNKNQLNRSSPTGPPRGLFNENDDWNGTKAPNEDQDSKLLRFSDQNDPHGPYKHAIHLEHDDQEYSSDGWGSDHLEDPLGPPQRH